MKTRVLSTFLAVFLVGSLSLALVTPILQGQEQEKKQEEKKAEKKKARKVWTNDDFPERPPPPPPPEEKKPEAPPAPEADLWPWDAIDRLTAERQTIEQELVRYREQLDTLEQERRDAFGDSLRRETIDQAIEQQEQLVFRHEERLKELNTLIADLEAQTKGRKRPEPKQPPAPPPPAEQPEAPPPPG